MNKNLLNRGIVLKKTDLNPALIPLDNVKSLILDYFDAANPIVNQFPDFLVFILPEKQFSVTIQNGSIAITDNPQIDSGNLDEMVKVATGINSLFNENDLTAYGINYNYLLDEADISKASSYIDAPKLLGSSVTSSESISLLNYSFIDNISDINRRTFMVNFVVADDGSLSDSVQATTNYHQDKSELPKFSDLKLEVINEQTEIEIKLDNLAG